MDTYEKIKLIDARNKHVFKTKILDEYSEGWLSKIRTKTVDKVPTEKVSTTFYYVRANDKYFILKSVICPDSLSEAIDATRREYKDSLRTYKMCHGVAKVCGFCESANKITKEIAIESLYGYKGQSLQELMEERSQKELFNIMKDVLNCMEQLEDNDLAHCHLNLENILIYDDKVRILDFGVSETFDTKSQYFSVAVNIRAKLTGEILAYYPPEVLKGESYIPIKVDVYSWGALLYQVLTKKNGRQLDDEMDFVENHKLNEVKYQEFIENLYNMEISDTVMKKLVVDMLKLIFKTKNKKRPTFKCLKSMVKSLDEYYMKEINDLSMKIQALQQMPSNF